MYSFVCELWVKIKRSSAAEWVPPVALRALWAFIVPSLRLAAAVDLAAHTFQLLREQGLRLAVAAWFEAISEAVWEEHSCTTAAQFATMPPFRFYFNLQNALHRNISRIARASLELAIAEARLEATKTTLETLSQILKSIEPGDALLGSLSTHAAVRFRLLSLPSPELYQIADLCEEQARQLSEDPQNSITFAFELSALKQLFQDLLATFWQGFEAQQQSIDARTRHLLSVDLYNFLWPLEVKSLEQRLQRVRPIFCIRSAPTSHTLATFDACGSTLEAFVDAARTFSSHFPHVQPPPPAPRVSGNYSVDFNLFIRVHVQVLEAQRAYEIKEREVLDAVLHSVLGWSEVKRELKRWRFEQVAKARQA
ncbi:hypothetical protein JCM1840_004913 [Sporobolomyces johnsonii]